MPSTPIPCNDATDSEPCFHHTSSWLSLPCLPWLSYGMALFGVILGETGQSPNHWQQPFVGRGQNLLGQPGGRQPSLHPGHPSARGRGAIHRRNLLFSQELRHDPYRDLTSAPSPGH